jgi:serine/threonine-protein kinase
MAAIPERLVAALADRYRLERELGAGGMATVNLAQDLKRHRPVAVKVLRPDLAITLGAERFLRKVGIAARPSHPHILPLHDSGEAQGFLYYVMPYVEGTSLRQKLSREGELPIPEAVRILRDLADAMAHAHAQGIVHRDIKPENVMLTGRHALVMDFGVAKALAEGQSPEGAGPRDLPASGLTSAGVALGTPAYMAPEQATGDVHVDARADLYAWGVVAYELLVGQPPFVRGTPQATLAAQMTATPEPVTMHRATIPAALAGLVMQCLEKRPADRPQTAVELVARLEVVLTPSGGITPTDTRPYQTAAARRAQRRRVLRGVAAVAALAVIGVLGWRFWPWAEVDWVTALRAPVAVLPFEVRGSSLGLEGIGVQFAEQVTAAIEQAQLAEVLPSRLAGEGAATLVSGTITVPNDSVEVQADLVRRWPPRYGIAT